MGIKLCLVVNKQKQEDIHKMGKKIITAWKHDIWLRILTIAALALIITAFLVPPTAVIDGSVLAAVGEIAGIMAIIELDKALDKGVDATVKHNNTELNVKNPDKEKTQDETI